MSDMDTPRSQNIPITRYTANSVAGFVANSRLRWQERIDKPACRDAGLLGSSFSIALAHELFSESTLEKLVDFIRPYSRSLRLSLLQVEVPVEKEEGEEGNAGSRTRYESLYSGLAFSYPMPESKKRGYFAGPLFVSVLHPLMRDEQLSLQEKREIVEDKLWQLLEYAPQWPDNELSDGDQFAQGMYIESRYNRQHFDGLIIGMPKRPGSPTDAFLCGENFTAHDGTVIEPVRPLHGFALDIEGDPNTTYYVITDSAEKKEELQQRMTPQECPVFLGFIQGCYHVTQEAFQEFIETVDPEELTRRQEFEKSYVGDMNLRRGAPDIVCR